MSAVATAIVASSVISGSMQSKAAKGAADTQAAAADRAAALEQRQFDIAREDLEPFRELGYLALKDIEQLKPFLTSQFGPEQFAQYLDPSMEFRRKLGEQSTSRLMNVGGGVISGNTLRGLEEFGQNLASTEYGNAFNRFQTDRGNIYNTLANIAGMGQNAVNTGVGAGQTFAAQQTGLITGQAAAQAAGQVGSANAYANALGNIGNYAMLNSFLRPNQSSSAVTNYGLSGGVPPTSGVPGMGTSLGTGLRPPA